MTIISQQIRFGYQKHQDHFVIKIGITFYFRFLKRSEAEYKVFSMLYTQFYLPTIAFGSIFSSQGRVNNILLQRFVFQIL